MKNEIMMILKMVEDNKVSVDDAVKLINAVNKNKNSNFEDFADDLKFKFNNMPKPNKEKIKKNAQTFFNKTEEIFDEVTNSIKDFFNTNDLNNNQPNNHQNNNNSNNNNNIINPNEEDDDDSIF